MTPFGLQSVGWEALLLVLAGASLRVLREVSRRRGKGRPGLTTCTPGEVAGQWVQMWPLLPQPCSSLQQQQQKKKRDKKKDKKKKEEEDVEDNLLIEKLKKLSAQASDEDEEGELEEARRQDSWVLSPDPGERGTKWVTAEQSWGLGGI